MQVLTVSDEVVSLVYNLQITQRFRGTRLLLSCGDLPYYYLEFVVTMLGVPCAYIHGNHDAPEITSGGEILHEPRGCTLLETRSEQINGLVLAGLGGSRCYNRRSAYQYTEAEMFMRAWRLVPRLYFNRLKHGRYLDVLLTHAPPLGIHDGPDEAHRGFRTFHWLLRRFHPRYLIHGHIHLSYQITPTTETRLGNTLVINTAGHRLLHLTPGDERRAG